MPKEMLSLREIGRRLEIPPSSIAYYKDRFARFIPTSGGKGRRVRYPSEALIMFKEIREMFSRNWSADQIEEQLAEMQHVVTSVTAENLRSAMMYEGGQADSANASRVMHTENFVQDISGVLDKMSSVLEAQAGFKSEIDSLRAEVEKLRSERVTLVEQYEQRIASMDAELDALREEQSATTMPDTALVNQPLVVKRLGEYLGVVGREKPFSMKDFITLIEQNAGSQKVQSMEWKHEQPCWVLHVVTMDDAGMRHDYLLRVVRTTTPSGNVVTELKKMSVDGETVPDKFVLMLFKNVKEGLER